MPAALAESTRRSSAAAVWVFCGDKEACSSQYQDCWIKHLVSAGLEISC